MKKLFFKRLASFLFLALLCAAAIPKKNFEGKTACKVVHVDDGDTVIILLNGKETTVRLKGVDTPETGHMSRPAQPYNKQATNFLKNLLEGESVFIEYEPGDKTDKYGRTLGYLFRAPDGLFVNLEIVRQGYGRAYTVYPFQYMDLFKEYEARARKAGKGVWSKNQK